MRIKEVVKILKADGWVELPGKATSHMQFKHPEKPGKVTVSNHSGDLPPFTLKSIWRQAQIEQEAKP